MKTDYTRFQSLECIIQEHAHTCAVWEGDAVTIGVITHLFTWDACEDGGLRLGRDREEKVCVSCCL